jgi:hypothetical protein
MKVIFMGAWRESTRQCSMTIREGDHICTKIFKIFRIRVISIVYLIIDDVRFYNSLEIQQFPPSVGFLIS